MVTGSGEDTGGVEDFVGASSVMVTGSGEMIGDSTGGGDVTGASSLVVAGSGETTGVVCLSTSATRCGDVTGLTALSSFALLVWFSFEAFGLVVLEIEMVTALPRGLSLEPPKRL